MGAAPCAVVVKRMTLFNVLVVRNGEVMDFEATVAWRSPPPRTTYAVILIGTMRRMHVSVLLL